MNRIYVSFEEFGHFVLNEKVFDLGSDIDLIIERSGIGKFYSEILGGGRPYYDEIMGDGEIVFLIMSSEELRSVDAMRAHSVNPIHILVGFASGGVQSQYNPYESYVLASPNRKFFKSLYSDGVSGLDSGDREIYESELGIERLKQTLAHELSHWISDSLHNSHIRRKLDRANELGRADYMKLRERDVNMTYFEIDALVHGISELRRGYSLEEWDRLTFRDIMLLYTSMQTIERRLRENYGLDISLIWQKVVMKRMSREGLLGRGMRSMYRGD